MSGNNKSLLFDVLHNRLVITGQLVAMTALRIGAGRSTEISGTDLPVLRDAAGHPFIPGASLKGAMRARLEGLIRAIGQEHQSSTLEKELSRLEAAINRARKADSNTALPKGLIEQQLTAAHGQVLDFYQIEKRTGLLRAFKENLRNRLADSEFTSIVWRLSTMIDLTFGSPEVAGRLFFKDAQVTERLLFGQHEVRHGVVLNRDTETAEEGLLYYYEVTPAGTRFDFELVLENADDWQRGMVLLLLKPWERGEMQLGGFRSRGLGHIKLIRNPEDKRHYRHYVEVKGVGDVVKLLAEELTDNVSEEQVQAWEKSFSNKLSESAVSTATGGISHA